MQLFFLSRSVLLTLKYSDVLIECFYCMCFEFNAIILKMAILKACIPLSLEAIPSHSYIGKGGGSSGQVMGGKPRPFSTEIHPFSQFCSAPSHSFKDSWKKWLNPTRTSHIFILCRLLAKSFVCQGGRLSQRKVSPDSDFCGCQGEVCGLGFLT